MNKKFNLHFMFIIIGAVLWGTAGIFVRTIEETPITQLQLVFGRMLFSCSLMAVVILVKDKNLFKIKLKDLWIFICGGVLSIVFFNYCYYTTMSYTSLSVAAVLMYTAPFFVMIISVFLFSEKLRLNKCVALLVAFVGCCAVSGVFSETESIGSKALTFGLLTGFGYALYTVFGELAIKRGYKSFTITFYVFLFAAMGAGAICSPVDAVSKAVCEPKIILVLLLMAIFNTVLPYIFYTAGLEGVEPTVAPIIAMLEPVVATVIGAVLYREMPTVVGVIGIMLVLASVVILNRNPVVCRANAKINLFLSILGKREDGYHLIDIVMQSIGLYDTVTVKKCRDIKVKCNMGEIENENNIAYKAAKLFFQITGINGGADIRIKKRIPMAAGLGGGSADAAAVLVALNKIYTANLSVAELEKAAATLGADVPFFITGGTARAEGIGEKITKLPDFNKGYFVLVKKENKPSTAEMYAKIDNENYEVETADEFIETLKNGDCLETSKMFSNTFALAWQSSAARRLLTETNADAVSLSGSGPVWFGYFEDKNSAKAVYKTLKKQGAEAYLANPVKKGIELE